MWQGDRDVDTTRCGRAIEMWQGDGDVYISTESSRHISLSCNDNTGRATGDI